MPEAQYCPEMRYGTFIQAWAVRHEGKGRVVAFADSTIFSNFCIGQPGKFPVLLNMIEWLNHRGGTGVWWLWMLLWRRSGRQRALDGPRRGFLVAGVAGGDGLRMDLGNRGKFRALGPRVAAARRHPNEGCRWW